MKLLIFGVGKYYQERKEYFHEAEIVAFIDNDKKKQGLKIDGIQIISAEAAVNLEFDYIYIMSIYKNEMKKQLLEIGISKDKICDFTQIGRLSYSSQMMVYYRKNDSFEGQQSKKKILLMSHELSYTGAPIVLFYAACILKKNGYLPVIISPGDGVLRNEIVSADIPVVIEKYISNDNLYILEWMKSFDLILVNTATFYYLIKDLNNFSKPVIWWIHEGEGSYWDIEDFPCTIYDNIYIYAGGYRALTTFRKYCGNHRNSETLLYGIPDENTNFEVVPKENDKIVFAVIATIIPRKAQDIFVEAIRYLEQDEREQAEFWIIGPESNSDFYKKIELMIAGIPQIKMMGEWKLQKLIEQYHNIDVVVCPSRDDPMPVVLTEAMMFYKVCIASEATGTASLIEDKINGLICKVEDAKNLAEQMKWVLQHKGNLKDMGIESRKLYDENFSMEVFEKNILKIVKELIPNKS
ncbi:MAG: glycosyltransferase family 4 protein [Mobilitalea sp.]